MSNISMSMSSDEESNDLEINIFKDKSVQVRTEPASWADIPIGVQGYMLSFMCPHCISKISVTSVMHWQAVVKWSFSAAIVKDFSQEMAYIFREKALTNYNQAKWSTARVEKELQLSLNKGLVEEKYQKYMPISYRMAYLEFFLQENGYLDKDQMNVLYGAIATPSLFPEAVSIIYNALKRGELYDLAAQGKAEKFADALYNMAYAKLQLGSDFVGNILAQQRVLQAKKGLVLIYKDLDFRGRKVVRETFEKERASLPNALLSLYLFSSRRQRKQVFNYMIERIRKLDHKQPDFRDYAEKAGLILMTLNHIKGLLAEAQYAVLAFELMEFLQGVIDKGISNIPLNPLLSFLTMKENLFLMEYLLNSVKELEIEGNNNLRVSLKTNVARILFNITCNQLSAVDRTSEAMVANNERLYAMTENVLPLLYSASPETQVFAMEFITYMHSFISDEQFKLACQSITCLLKSRYIEVAEAAINLSSHLSVKPRYTAMMKNSLYQHTLIEIETLIHLIQLPPMPMPLRERALRGPRNAWMAFLRMYPVLNKEQIVKFVKSSYQMFIWLNDLQFIFNNTKNAVIKINPGLATQNDILIAAILSNCKYLNFNSPAVVNLEKFISSSAKHMTVETRKIAVSLLRLILDKSREDTFRILAEGFLIKLETYDEEKKLEKFETLYNRWAQELPNVNALPLNLLVALDRALPEIYMNDSNIAKVLGVVRHVLACMSVQANLQDPIYVGMWFQLTNTLQAIAKNLAINDVGNIIRLFQKHRSYLIKGHSRVVGNIEKLIFVVVKNLGTKLKDITGQVTTDNSRALAANIGFYFSTDLSDEYTQRVKFAYDALDWLRADFSVSEFFAQTYNPVFLARCDSNSSSFVSDSSDSSYNSSGESDVGENCTPDSKRPRVS